MVQVDGLLDTLRANPALLLLGAAILIVVLAIIVWIVRRRPPLPKVILDGSNVMYWRGDGPELDAVREVLDAVSRAGYAPGVIFDANAGYLISSGYRDDAWFATALRLPSSRALVVPKGHIADKTILLAARDQGARIVTNDRYRDWRETHPEIAQPGYLIRGDYDQGRLRLQLEIPDQGRSST